MSMMFRVVPILCLALGALLVSCNERQGAKNPEIEVEVERVAASKAKSPRDIQPYDEAIAWHEYRVLRVLSGKLEASVIRVAHWTVVAAKAVPVSAKAGERVSLKLVPFESLKGMDDVAASDDLDFTASEPPKFLDMSQALAQTGTPDVIRHDYRGNVSDQMRLFWKLRGQLSIVAMGNSHATKGVCPREFLGNPNWITPLMLNMAPAGSNNRQQCLMLREYVLPLPKIEWVMWVVSARNFNGQRKDERKYQEFTASPGWLYDQKHKNELWPAPAQEKLVTSDELMKLGITSVDVWGWQGIGKSMLPRDPDDLRKFVLNQCDSTRFSWSEEIFAEFRDTALALSRKGIKVLVFTTPLHPFTKEANASDPDGTTHAGFMEMARHMEEFDKQTPGLWFRDFHQGGDHEFPSDEFYDVDHLNRPGTSRLGGMIRAWMDECVAKP
jgi:hypothetical protein